MALYTIGFTQSTAEHFFERLCTNGVDLVLDIRLNNTSQLASFAKMPDFEFFLKKLTSADYVHDTNLAPTDDILTAYKKKQITWDEYKCQFDYLLRSRDIDKWIGDCYAEACTRRYCLLCSEAEPEYCHRRLIAERFAQVLALEIIHL